MPKPVIVILVLLVLAWGASLYLGSRNHDAKKPAAGESYEPPAFMGAIDGALAWTQPGFDLKQITVDGATLDTGKRTFVLPGNVVTLRVAPDAAKPARTRTLSLGVSTAGADETAVVAQIARPDGTAEDLRPGKRTQLAFPSAGGTATLSTIRSEVTVDLQFPGNQPGFDLKQITVDGANLDTAKRKFTFPDQDKPKQAVTLRIAPEPGKTSRRLTFNLISPATAPAPAKNLPPGAPPQEFLAQVTWRMLPPFVADLPDKAKSPPEPVAIFPDRDAHRRDQGSQRYSLVVYEGGGTVTLNATGPALTLKIE